MTTGKETAIAGIWIGVAIMVLGAAFGTGDGESAVGVAFVGTICAAVATYHLR